MTHIGEFEQMILFAVYQLKDDAYGVGIREFIEERTGRAVASGAIYTALGRLEERGLVKVAGESNAGGPGRPRKFYRVETEGARAAVDAYDAMTSMARGALAGLTRMAEG
jgi:DNA-binding PadR family transcriptional regulator